MNPSPEAGGAWTATHRAQLALLLELAGTPKPGNVDRERDHPDLLFEHLLAGAVGAIDGLRAAATPSVARPDDRDVRGHADDTTIGSAFETAVAGMSRQRGGNTQFGALLLLCPLVRAAVLGDGAPSEAGASAVVEATTVEDAACFYRALEHVDVAAGPPPADAADLDVRRGTAAIPAVRVRGLTLRDVLALGAETDGVAAEWVGGFERTFRAAELIAADDGPVADRAARCFLELLAAETDTLVATRHGESVAASVSERAAALVETDADRATVAAFAETLAGRGINPGTTADLVAAGLYVALERGVEV